MAKSSVDKQRTNSEGRNRSLANLKPFPKGVSGNPAGRPKSITLSEAFRRQLSQPASHDPEGRTFAEVIALRVCVAAAQGDVGAAREIADRTEGRARQSFDVDMSVSDWRQIAERQGLSEQDVLREAQRLIESVTGSGGA